MAQFDIYKNSNRLSKKEIPYLMDIQSDSVSVLDTRIVVPLRNAELFKKRAVSRIHISIEVNEVKFIAFVSEMAAVPTGMIDKPISNKADKHTEIIGAIDLLFTGF